MRMTRRRRQGYVRRLAAGGKGEAPAFPHVRRMTRRRSRRLRARLAKFSPPVPSFPHVLRMTRRRRRERQEREELARAASRTAAASLGSVYVLQGAGQAASLNAFTDVPSYFDYMRNERERIKNHRLATENAALSQQWTAQAKEDLAAATDGVRQAGEAVQVAERALADGRGELSRTNIALARARDASGQATRAAVASQQAVADFMPQVYAQQAERDRLAAIRGAREAAYRGLAAQADDAWGMAAGSAAAADRAQLIEETWQSVDYAQNQLETVRAIVDGRAVPGGASALSARAAALAAEAAQQEAQLAAASRATDEAQAVLDGLWEYADVLNGRRDAAEAAEEAARQLVRDIEGELAQREAEVRRAEQSVQEARAWLEDAQNWQEEARDALAQSEREQEQAEYELAHFGEGREFALGMEYYAWQGAAHGHQLYLPLAVSGEEHGWNWSLETGYVSSSSGEANGHVAGWTDTTLAASIVNRHPKNDVRYKLAVNLPTGQAGAHENANLDDDLARLTSFGEGWNITPEIDVTHHITEEDSVTGRMSWSWRGKYERYFSLLGEGGSLLGEAKGDYAPGNLWRQEIEYLHAGEREQLLALVSHQSTDGASMRSLSLRQAGESAWMAGGDAVSAYRKGDEWSARLFYSADVSAKDAWQAYLALDYDGRDRVQSNLAAWLAGGDAADALTGHVQRQQYGLGWRHAIDGRQSWQLMAHYMKTTGNGYNNVTGEDIGRRSRRALQLGYDCRLSPQESLQLKLERYVMHYDTGGGYHGWSTSLLYYRSL